MTTELQLVISDLSYLEVCQESEQIKAGYVDTGTFTDTGPGFSVADAWAVALGDNTQTDAQTYAGVEIRDQFTFSLADARSSARASTDNTRESSWSTSTSLGFSTNSQFITTTE